VATCKRSAESVKAFRAPAISCIPCPYLRPREPAACVVGDLKYLLVFVASSRYEVEGSQAAEAREARDGSTPAFRRQTSHQSQSGGLLSHLRALRPPYGEKCKQRMASCLPPNTPPATQCGHPCLSCCSYGRLRSAYHLIKASLWLLYTQHLAVVFACPNGIAWYACGMI